MNIIRAGDYRRMAWKNGAGETTEIVVSPAGASLDSFDWRVSMARVALAGPFSVFPGIDRTLCILTGRGIDLTIAGQGTRRLDRDSDPLRFSADVAAAADLRDGAIEDLNVMTRRGRFDHSLRRIRTERPTGLSRTGEVMLVLIRGAGAVLKSGAAEIEALDGDTGVFEAPGEAAAEVRPSGLLDLYVIDIRRV
ncbi:HutD/Ves family protein [Phreatobacter stygius]|uniref:HutD family protein n=1 Tax=Phreatobacter stygius TaxID=1940610 RepID=A0A4D7BED8_9HYPH|nr:HutD family protein [Phreatobacter stygius]QCI67666.1 HutD family protein [Phreatobacter stygius]